MIKHKQTKSINKSFQLTTTILVDERLSHQNPNIASIITALNVLQGRDFVYDQRHFETSKAILQCLW